MFTLDHSLHLSIPLARAWRLLADVDRCQDWHPFVMLKRDPDDPRRLTYTHRRRGRPRFSAEAVLSKIDRHHAIAWRIGVPWLLEIEESFVVSKEAHGTCVVHSTRYAGLLALAFVPFFRRGLHRMLMATDKSLAAHVKRGSTIARYSQGKLK
jgi:hypothetical protein